MNNYENLTQEKFMFLKHWLFEENIRIEQEKQKILQEKSEHEQAVIEFEREKEAHELMHNLMKKQLTNEKKLFDQKWKILERELTLLAYDKEQIKKEKEILASEKNKTKEKEISEFFLFKGVTSLDELKKRYKELIKIFHPDNCGNTDIMQIINKQYENCKIDF